MFGWFFRRLVPMGPALLLFGVVLFALVASVPPPDLDAEGQAKRALHLPVLFNLDPEDRPRLVPALVERAASSTGEARARGRCPIGAAGLPELGPRSKRLSPGARGAVAHELQPLAVRMGQIDASDLDDPKKAESYFRRLLDEHGADLRPASVKRTLRRLLEARDEPSYRAELRAADTAVIAPIFEVLGQKPTAADRTLLESLAADAVKQAGYPRPEGRARLLAWWSLHRAEYREHDPLERLVAHVTDTRLGRYAAELSQGTLGRSLRDDKPVGEDLRARAPKTIGRVLTALALAYLGGLPLAWLLTARRRQAPARVIGTASVVLYALPAFMLALAIRGASGAFARNEVFVAVALALVPLAPISRQMRASVLDVATAHWSSPRGRWASHAGAAGG
ncbi:MAG: hypothetical protein IPJ34_24095 [Myxococcales bacterium]|nr:hypothetical protein [Myxococcales bacterium]